MTRVLLRLLIGLVVLTGAEAVAMARPQSKAPGSVKPPANDDCLACHGDAGAVRANGTSVAVKAPEFAASIHGAGGVACVDCHTDLATGAEFPHPDKLKPAQCAACHDKAVAAYETGVHAQARRSGKNLTAAACVDCHGTHDIKPSADPESLTHHSKLLDTCGRCHGDEEIIKRGKIQIGNVVDLFRDSIHGRALTRSGLTVAPTCSDCHGNHDIRRKTDAASRVYRRTIPLTCGKCHEGIAREYWTSIHGAQVQKGSPLAPVCSSCHTAHEIRRADMEGWKVTVIKECGTCHEESIKTYRDTFHGQVTALGYSRVASCADCHGSHSIVPKSDPRSRVSDANRLQTCKKCHSGATASFAQYDPHGDPSNRARNPLLFYTSEFMKMLLIGVFAFFGIHTGLWFGRGLQMKAAARLRGSGKDDSTEDGR
ncbi:MAG: cytochrome c3 family protein [Acidobacteriota bacterium]